MTRCVAGLVESCTFHAPLAAACRWHDVVETGSAGYVAVRGR
jgi:hypothetical protein